MVKGEKKSRYLAGISLAVMGTGFVLTIPYQDFMWGRLLQGGFEAGLVGGLADWFAVTALFRHPLGIPIPHTALLPKNREKITRSIVRLLEEEWLTVESIMGKMKQIRFSEKILTMIRKQLHGDPIKKIIHTLILNMLHKIDLEKFTPIIEKELKGYLSRIDAAKLLSSISHGILERQYEEAAFDYILEEAGKWAATPEAKETMGKVGKQLIETTEADGLLKFAIQSFSQLVNEEKIGQMVQTFTLNRIRNVSKSDNRYRRLILDWIRKELNSVDQREKLMGEVNEWKDHFVEQLELNKNIYALLQDIKERMILFVSDEDFVDKYVYPAAFRLMDKLQEDKSKMSAFEDWLHNQVASMVENNHSKIGVLVKENLDKLDNETLIDMIENHIGKDIQWIRVNGALCGFIIGLCLTIFKILIY